MINDHDIHLDMLLSDASTHLNDQGMHALGRAVEVAREKLCAAPVSATLPTAPDPEERPALRVVGA